MIHHYINIICFNGFVVLFEAFHLLVVMKADIKPV